MKMTESEDGKELPSTTAGADAKEGEAQSSSAGGGAPTVPEADGPLLHAPPLVPPETDETASVLRSASQVCHSSSFDDTAPESAVYKARVGFPSQALFIDQKWCEKIFNKGKYWELRSCARFVLIKQIFALCVCIECFVKILKVQLQQPPNM